MSAQAKAGWSMCLIVVLISAIGGGLFGLAVGDMRFVSLWRGMLTATLVSTPIVFFELFYARAPAGRRLREAPLARFFSIKTAFYALATLVGEFAARSAFADTPAGGPIAFDIELLRSFAFMLMASAVFNFVLVVNQMLGRNVLRHYLTGRYHRPRREDRIFMFIDLVGSTATAERIGNERFLNLLNRFIFDVTEPVLRHGGEIYRYVGDEVIVTWKLGDAAANARALACALDIERTVAGRAGAYETRFGATPAFRLALHAGPVVAGEMGDYKREIAFLGDAVNTTARIEQACRELGRPMLASADLVERATASPDLALESIGPVPLRGRAEPVSLYAIAAG